MLISAPAMRTVKRPPRVSCVWKKASPTVSVVFGTFGMYTNGCSRSFQAPWKVKIARAASAGFPSGR